MKPEMDSVRTVPAQPIVNENNSETIRLASARPGEPYKIVGVDGGSEVQTRLFSLGILPGQEVRILKSGSFGPTMICVKGARVALGQGISFKIFVRPCVSSD